MLVVRNTNCLSSLPPVEFTWIVKLKIIPWKVGVRKISLLFRRHRNRQGDEAVKWQPPLNMDIMSICLHESLKNHPLHPPDKTDSFFIELLIIPLRSWVVCLLKCFINQWFLAVSSSRRHPHHSVALGAKIKGQGHCKVSCSSN